MNVDCRWRCGEAGCQIIQLIIMIASIRMLNYGDSNRVWLNVIATLTFTHLYSLFFCVRCGVKEETTTFFNSFFFCRW